MARRAVLATSLIVTSSLALVGCSSGGEDPAGDKIIKVAYMKSDGFTALDALFTRIKPQFEKDHPGVKIELQPIEAGDADYSTKLNLMHGSAETSPDVFYEDTFMVRSDIDADYLLKLDDYLAKWDDWKLFNEGAKAAGKGDDGGIYAVPLGTDTRGIYYSKSVFEKAGISTPWKPKDWNEILTTARTIKKALPDVIPFNLTAGKPAGEGSVMQGFGMLVYGTDDPLYDEAKGSWVAGSQGFIDSLAFIKTLYGEGLAPSPDVALDANMWQTLYGKWFPEGTIGANVDGSWGPSFWKDGGPYEWKGYGDDVLVAPFPTQNGQQPGAVSLSGGWTLALSAKSKHPQEAFDFLALALNKENQLAYNIENSQIAVRTDVASEPSYLEANPFVEFFSDAVSWTHFRPATADYPAISAEIQAATEAVMTGQKSPEEAAASYDEALKRIVGADKVTGG